MVFSEDLGLVRASAQGIRKSSSKLRGHLEDYYLSNVSLVKGREVWRITNAEAISPKLFGRDLEKLVVVKNVFDLLLRLIHGEEKNEELFSVIETFYEYLSNNVLSGDSLKDIEALVVLRILRALGYLKETSKAYRFAEKVDISADLLREFNTQRKLAIGDINQALKETHL